MFEKNDCNKTLALKGHDNKMAVDPAQHDAGLDREFGNSVRPAVGGIVRGLIEAASEDITGPDLARFIALVVWISVGRLSKKLGINIRPWFAGRWLLNVIVVLLKQVQPPDALMAFWRTKLGVALDVAWDGLLDGVRLRATDYLNEWSRKMSEEERKKLMDPNAYARAEAFVNRFLGASGDNVAKDGKKGDGAATAAATFGPNLDYGIYLRELEESGDAAKATLATELRPLWIGFGAELPKHASAVGRASLLGYMPVDEITRALRASRVGTPIDDPERAKKKISEQHYALKALAGFAQQRLEAHPLTLVDPEKKEERLPDPVYTPGREVAHERELALEAYLTRGSSMEQMLRPYQAVPLPFIGNWRRLLGTSIALLILFVIVMVIRGFVGNDPGTTPPVNVQPVSRQRVDGGVTRRDAGTDAGNRNRNINPNQSTNASAEAEDGGPHGR